MTGTPPPPRGRFLKGGARNSLLPSSNGVPSGLQHRERKTNKPQSVAAERLPFLPGVRSRQLCQGLASLPPRLRPGKPPRAPLGVREATQAAAASAATTPHPAPLEPQTLPPTPPGGGEGS